MSIPVSNVLHANHPHSTPLWCYDCHLQRVMEENNQESESGLPGLAIALGDNHIDTRVY